MQPLIESVEKKSRLLLAVLIVVLTTILTKSFVTQSLWLDESISYWVIKDGSKFIFERAFNFQGQSPLYYYFLWIWSLGFGSSELALRLPSILALLASLYFLYSITKHFLSENAALFACIAYASLTSVAQTLSARPYACATLLCFVSIWSLLNWSTYRNVRFQYIYIISTILMFYVHYLFAGVVLLHFLLVQRKTVAVSIRNFAGSILLVGLGCALGLIQLSMLFNRKGTLYFAKDPAWSDLLLSYIPYYWLVYIGLSLIFAAVAVKGFSLRKLVQLAKTPRHPIIFWYLFPPLLFFAYSKLGSGSLFVERYFVWHAGGAAIVLASVYASIEPARARLLAYLMFSVLVFVREMDKRWTIEDWKGASMFINQAIKRDVSPPSIFIQPGLVEARQVDWLNDLNKHEYLLAPFSFYPINAQASLLPPNFKSLELQNYFSSSIEPKLNTGTDIILVSYRTDDYFELLFKKYGYTASEFGGNRALGFWRFTTKPKAS